MKALIAMSGGVDSSVAALLTKNMGYECVGCTMKLYNNEDAGVPKEHTCCSLDDVEDARSVAHRLGMQYFVFNFSDDFKEKVVDSFICSYLNGRTPNPCIDCNRYMKFDKLFDRAKVMECDYIVTGHYARIEKINDKYVLKKALDDTKDQSYVLYSMNQYQLAHILFPLGELKKTDVREIAEKNDFINASKPDSQDICFVPDGNYAKVIEEHTGKKSMPGDFLDKEGNVIGKHKGIIHYTVGQHKRLGMPFGEPKYVLGVNAKNNTITLGASEDLFNTDVYVENVNWISETCPEKEFRCCAKVRYRHKEQACSVFVLDNDKIKIVFDEPQRAITPGQSAVLYNGDIVLGGGIIS